MSTSATNIIELA